jgi:hypothetical protein
LSERPPRLTLPAKLVLGVLLLAMAGFAAALVLRLQQVRGLPVAAIAGGYGAAALIGVLVVVRSRARMRKRRLASLRDLTISEEGIRLPAGTLSTRVVPWHEVADIVARPSVHFGDGFTRDAIWLELITGESVESSVQCFVPRSRLERAPDGKPRFEQTAVLDPELFDAVIRRLRRELRGYRIRADARRRAPSPRYRRS